jgi:SNF2 family DNA or RNA helicase
MECREDKASSVAGCTPEVRNLLPGYGSLSLIRFSPLQPPGIQGKIFHGEASLQEETASGTRPIRPSKTEGLLVRPLPRSKNIPWDLIYSLLTPSAGFCSLPGELYSYQRIGVEFLISHPEALLADEMGTGKTVMTTVAIKILFQQNKIRKALIVCPLSMVGVWEEHLDKWAPGLSLLTMRGGRETRKLIWECPVQILLTTFDTLRSDLLDEDSFITQNILKEIDLVVVDEAQNIKNSSSRRSQAVKKIPARWRWALTGTPLENRLEDLSSIFEFVKPNCLPQNGLTPKLAQQLVKPYLLRRLKQDVMKDLPPKIKQDTWLELDAFQRRAYQRALYQGQNHLEQIGRKGSSSPLRAHIFAIIQTLKQICNFAPGKATSPKTEALIELVEKILANGKKVLVFSQYQEEGVYKLAKALESYGVVMYTGAMSERERQSAIATFRRSQDKSIFLASVRSAGVGLTLTEANYVVHFDHWWNPALMWQAEDRAHRRGQTEPVHVYHLWMRDTIEMQIYNKLKEKGLLIQEVMEDLSSEVVENSITTEEWLEMLGLKSPSR